MDYSKAFDSVQHALLLKKLTNYGISGPLLSWITDYLDRRRQSVLINGVYSTPSNVSSGVIQGSVLGSLLFLTCMFVNDVDQCVAFSRITKYADDIKLSIAFPKDDIKQRDASDKLQQDLSSLQSWSYNNGLSLNPLKCKVMHFGRSNLCHPFFIGSLPIVSVPSIKDLGVYVNNTCTFHEHVSVTVNKANRLLGFVKRCFLSRNNDLLLTLYKSLVRSILEFSCILWCPYRSVLSNHIEGVQRRFTRTCFPHLRHLDYRERLNCLNLLSLFARRIRYKLIFLYKLMNGLTDLNPHDFFLCSSAPYLRGNTRRLRVPSSSRDYRRFFFSVDVVFHWNSMTEAEVSAPNVQLFKRSIDAYFRRHDIW